MGRGWGSGFLVLAGLFAILTSQNAQAQAQPKTQQPSLDARVEQFLESNRNRWNAWNVPFEDGKILHDIVVANGFKNILEIGTSTGHSTIWLAWAASKTGGKVVTIEIDPGRHRTALENFKKAGVEAYIDARLAGAHDLVRELPGPLDFVFNDADKEWYLNYFRDLDAKVAIGGCFTPDNTLSIHTREGRDFLGDRG